MYPRNAASPERLAIGQVVLIADGTIQTSGVSITVRGQGGAEASGGGTIAYGADGTVYYTPTQAETNFTSFVIIASKASCFSASLTIITTASATPGNVVLSPQTHTSAVIPTVSTVTDGAKDSTVAKDATVAKDSTVAKAATALSNATWTDAKAALIDVAISTRLASASYTAPDNATIAAIAGYVDTEVAAILSAVDTEVAAIKTVTDKFVFTGAGPYYAQVDVVDWKGSAAPNMTGDAYARLGAPTGVSVSADIAAVKSDTAAILDDTGTSGVIVSATSIDAVWDEPIAGHLTAGTTGNALNSAGSSGDPWSTPIPGAYGAGTAGYVVGSSLDAAVSSRLSAAGYTAPDNATITAIAGYVDTEVAAILSAVDTEIATLLSRLGVPVGVSISADIQAAKFDPATTPVEVLASGGTAGINAAELVTLFWSDTLTAYTDGQAGKRLKLLGELVGTEITVNDASATTTSFITDRIGGANLSDLAMKFNDGTNDGQSKVITTHDTVTGRMTFDEPWSAAPANGATAIIGLHAHSISAITNAILAKDMGDGRTIEQALHALRNKVTVSGGTMTVYDTDDATPSWSATVTTAPGDPITSVDPA